MPVRIEKIKSIFSWGGGGWWLVFVEELPGQITRRHLTSVSFRTPHVSLAIQPGRWNNPLKIPFPSTEQKGKRKNQMKRKKRQLCIALVSPYKVDLGYSSVSGMSAVPSSVKYQGLILQISNSADAWTWKRAFIQKRMDLLVTEIKGGGGTKERKKKKKRRENGNRTKWNSLSIIQKMVFNIMASLCLITPQKNPTAFIANQRSALLIFIEDLLKTEISSVL